MDKQSIITAFDKIAFKLRALVKDKETVREKLEVTAEELKQKAEQLAVTAKEKEDTRKKLVVTAEELKQKAEQLAVTAKEKESVRNKLIVTAENLAKLAKEKESIKNKLIIVAEKLAVTAKEKEDTREKLEVTAEELKLKAEQLAVTAKEKEDTRKKLEVTAEELRKSRETLEDKVLERTNDLAQAKVRDEAILQSIGEGLVVVDKEGNIIYVNQAFEQILGWGMKEVMGKPLTDVVPREDEEGNKVAFKERILSQVLAGKKAATVSTAVTTTSTSTATSVTTVTLSVLYFVRKDKTKFPANIVVTPIIIDNEVIGAVEVFRDITKEREIDKVKTEFVSLASHQLRTPLSAINWYAEMLLSGEVGEVNPKQKMYLDQVYRGNKRMVTLVNSLLNVSRLELGTFAIEPKPTDVAKVLEDTVQEYRKQSDDKKIKLSSSIEKNIPIMSADPKLLHIIMENILSNAIKYTPELGKIDVSLSLDNHKNVLLKVSDTGYGIPKNQQENIFTKLFRADNVREKDTEGTGLGLYIAKSIVDRSAGKIWFTSEENKGTTFFVTIPITGMKEKKGSKKII